MLAQVSKLLFQAILSWVGLPPQMSCSGFTVTRLRETQGLRFMMRKVGEDLLTEKYFTLLKDENFKASFFGPLNYWWINAWHSVWVKNRVSKFCEGMQLYPLQKNQYSNKRYLLTQKLACGTQLSRHSYQVASMYSLKLNGPWSRSLSICRFLKEGWPSTLRHLKLSTHGSFLKRYVRRQFQTV